MGSSGSKCDNCVTKDEFEQFKKTTFADQDDKDIYPFRDNDNVYNFNRSLRKYYQNSFIEIVSETSFTEPCYLITEKTLNSIYGCNFPIILCGCGSIQLLRDIGFDVFDDIIDHSYDQISDPIGKIYSALDKNRNLLNNDELVKDLWLKNKHRFLKNIDVARNNMHNFYQNRAEEQWKKLRYLYE